MSLLYFVFLILLSNFSSNVAKGLRPEKIVGGLKSRKGEFKFVAAVMYNSTVHYENPCAASIVSDNFIATVAHCFYIKESGQLRNAEFYVSISVRDLQEPPYPPIRHIRIAIVIMPRSYNPFGPDDHTKVGDLAIVKLAESIEWTPRHLHLSKLMLRSANHRSWCRQYYVAGYGFHEIYSVQYNFQNGTYLQDGKSDGKLRYAKVNILTNEQCVHILQTRIAPGILCGKAQRNKLNIPVGICKFDSGGPLYHDKYLDGIAINGQVTCNEDQKPGFYVDVKYYNQFISDAMAENYTENMYIVQQVMKQNQFVFEKLNLENTS